MTNTWFLDHSKIPPAKGEYVLWCDGMGTSRELNRSIVRTAGFVFRLHQAFAVAQSEVRTIRSYPVMDGLYITTGSRRDLCRVIRLAFVQFARDFNEGHGTKNKFMMRAGLAYGPVLHGRDIPEEAFADPEQIRDTKSSVLLSPAMVLAYRAESKAPPFGIYVDDSAKTFPQLTKPEDAGFISNLYQWWRDDENATAVASRLHEQIVFYLSKSKVHSVGTGYTIDRIKAHGQLVDEYFGGLLKARDAQQVRIDMTD